MRRKVSDVPPFEENHNFVASVVDRDGRKHRLICRIWLPIAPNDDVKILLSPPNSGRAFPRDLPSPVRIDGTYRDSGTRTHVVANDVWVPRVRTRALANARRDVLIETLPPDVLITRRLDNPTARRTPTYVSYTLSPCAMLEPTDRHTYSYTGEVSLTKCDPVTFKLRNGTRLTFERHYEHDIAPEQTVTTSSLVARTESIVPRKDFFELDTAALEQIDELLALVSFAYRHPVICREVHSSNVLGDTVDYYRQSISAPEAVISDVHLPLIPPADFWAFLEATYQKYAASGPNMLLTRALHLIVPREPRTVESSFTTLYAALEMITLWYRQRNNCELIITDDAEWKSLVKDLNEYLGKHAVLTGSTLDRKRRRSLMYGKLSELRRVPFRAVFEQLCADFGIDLSDLWPLFGPAAEMPLTEIRNRLVHGNAFAGSQFGPMSGAEEHMRWTVERVMLRVLGWPVERSRASRNFLTTTMLAMSELHQDRTAIGGNMPPVSI